MEKTKERRIRKLRKKRIWPSIIGLFFILGMIMIAVSGEMLTLISNIVNRELMYGYRLSEKVAKSAEVVLKDETKSPEEMMKLIEYMMDEVKAVCIFDEDGELLWASSDKQPDPKEVVQGVISLSGKEMVVDVMIPAGEEFFSFSVDGDLQLREKFLNLTDISNIRMDGSRMLVDEDVWYMLPAQGKTVWVMCNLRIYGQDLQLAIIGMSFLLFVIALFSIYYLWSMIGMIVSQKRTTKIIYTDMITGGENWLAFIRKSTRKIKKVRKLKKKTNSLL